MSFMKRTLLYLYRKKGKTVILFLLILTKSTFILTCFSILYATEDVAKQMRTSVGAAFHLRVSTGFYVDENGDMQIDTAELPVITDTPINEIMTLQEVKLYNARNSGYAKSNQISFFPGVGNTEDNNMGEVSANTYSALHPDFRGGNLELIQGRHITAKDQSAVLISEEIAGLNGLSVGDELLLVPAEIGMEDGVFYNKLADGTASVTAKVAGIYRILVPHSDTFNQPTAGLLTNKIFSDHAFLTELGLAVIDQYTGGVSFFIGDPVVIDNIVTEVQQMDSIDWDSFFIYKEDFAFGKIADGLAMIQRLITILLTCVSIVSVAFLILILAIRIRGRMHEAGILLSIGIPKRQVVFQFIAEVMTVAVIGFILSFLLASALSNAIEVRLLGDMQIEQLSEQLLSTGIASATRENTFLRTPSTATTLLYLCQTGVIILSVFTSSMAIVKLKPRDILSKMN